MRYFEIENSPNKSKSGEVFEFCRKLSGKLLDPIGPRGPERAPAGTIATYRVLWALKGPHRPYGPYFAKMGASQIEARQTDQTDPQTGRLTDGPFDRPAGVGGWAGGEWRAMLVKTMWQPALNSFTLTARNECVTENV